MSRHRFIKKLDLDDELNDFDGGADYDDEGGEGAFTLLHAKEHTLTIALELSAEDKGMNIKYRHIHDSGYQSY